MVHLGVLGLEFDDVRHRVDHHADNAATDIEHDGHGQVVVLHVAHAELDTQIDDGNDHAAQIHDTLDEGGQLAMRVGSP